MDSCPFWNPVSWRYRRYVSGYCAAGDEPMSIPSIEEMAKWCETGDFRECPSFPRVRSRGEWLERETGIPAALPLLDPDDAEVPAGGAAHG